MNSEAKLFYTRIATDTAGSGNYDLVLHLYGGSIRRLTSIKGEVPVPKHVTRKVPAQLLPAERYSGKATARVQQGSVVSIKFQEVV